MCILYSGPSYSKSYYKFQGCSPEWSIYCPGIPFCVHIVHQSGPGSPIVRWLVSCQLTWFHAVMQRHFIYPCSISCPHAGYCVRVDNVHFLLFGVRFVLVLSNSDGISFTVLYLADQVIARLTELLPRWSITCQGDPLLARLIHFLWGPISCKGDFGPRSISWLGAHFLPRGFWWSILTSENHLLPWWFISWLGNLSWYFLGSDVVR